MKKRIFGLILCLPLVMACSIDSKSFISFYNESVVPFFESFSIENTGVNVSQGTNRLCLRKNQLNNVLETLNGNNSKEDFDYLLECSQRTITEIDEESSKIEYNSYVLDVYQYQIQNTSIVQDDQTFTNLTQLTHSWMYSSLNEETTYTASTSQSAEQQTQISLATTDYISSSGETIMKVDSIWYEIRSGSQTSITTTEGNFEIDNTTSNMSSRSAWLVKTTYQGITTSAVNVENRYVDTTTSNKFDAKEYNTIDYSQNRTVVEEISYESPIDDIQLTITTTTSTRSKGETESSYMESYQSDGSSRIELFENLFPESEMDKYTRQNLYNSWVAKEEELALEDQILNLLNKCQLDTETAFSNDAIYKFLFVSYSYTKDDLKVVYDLEGYPVTLAFDQDGSRLVYNFSFYEY